jgi:hypothetical protein
MRRFTWIGLVALAAVMLAVGPAAADDDGGTKSWSVTITNLTPAGPGPPGASRTFTLQTDGRFNRLSLVTMLVNTNDAFTGLDSLKLRGRGETHSTAAYDAGSELNNELETHIPGPCCNNPFVRAPEGELIRHHPGITGVGDLDPALYGWSNPVARIEIERVS